MRSLLTTVLALLLLIAATALGGCADDGKDLAEPLPSQTTTTRPPPPTIAPPDSVSASGVRLQSPDFNPGDEIPEAAKCSGDNQFPNLAWTPIPEGTTELVLTLSDQTDPASPLLLWMMAGIDPSVSALTAGVVPDGAVQTLNDYGNLGYGSPCLESFTTGYRDIQFRLYLLPQSSEVGAGDAGNEAWEKVQARAAESATLLARVDAVANTG